MGRIGPRARAPARAEASSLECGCLGAFRAGGGFDFYLSESVVVNVDATYLLPFLDVESLDYLSIGFGIQYRF